MPITVCKICSSEFEGMVNQKYCKKCCTINCDICGKPFVVRGKRVFIAKYCSCKCAHIGQPKNRIVWNKGLTKQDDVRIMSASEKLKSSNWMKGLPSEMHPMFGKKHNPESLKKISENSWMKGKTKNDLPESILKGLELGRTYFKGKTKDNCESVKRRAKILSKKYVGRKNPEHSEWAKRYYKENPEKHPCVILSRRKNKRTSIEQLMYDNLIQNKIDFLEQYPIDGYIADFAILDHNVIIECDGEYWHNKENDLKRDEHLKILGFETIRFSEKQLKKNIKLCIDTIKGRLYRGNFTDYERL